MAKDAEQIKNLPIGHLYFFLCVQSVHLISRFVDWQSKLGGM